MPKQSKSRKLKPQGRPRGLAEEHEAVHAVHTTHHLVHRASSHGMHTPATGELKIGIEFTLEIEEPAEGLSDDTIDQIQSDAADIIQEGGESIEEDAKANAPVRTGLLRASIYHQVTDVTGLEVGAWAPYAAFIEYGTSKRPAQPFLEPAIMENQPMIQEQIDSMVAERMSQDPGQDQGDDIASSGSAGLEEEGAADTVEISGEVGFEFL